MGRKKLIDTKNQQKIGKFFRQSKDSKNRDDNINESKNNQLQQDNNNQKNAIQKKQDCNQIREENQSYIQQLREKYNIKDRLQTDQPLIHDIIYTGYKRKIVKFTELYIVHQNQDKEQFDLYQPILKRILEDPWKISKESISDINVKQKVKQNDYKGKQQTLQIQQNIQSTKKMIQKRFQPINNMQLDFQKIYKNMQQSRNVNKQVLYEPKKIIKQRNSQNKNRDEFLNQNFNQQSQKQKNFLEEFEYRSMSQISQSEKSIESIYSAQIHVSNINTKKIKIFNYKEEETILKKFTKKYQLKIKHSFLMRIDQPVFKFNKIEDCDYKNSAREFYTNKKHLIVGNIKNKIFLQFPFIDEDDIYIRSLIKSKDNLSRKKNRIEVKKAQNLQIRIEDYDDIMSLQCSTNHRKLDLYHSPYSVLLKGQNLIVKSDIKNIYRPKIQKFIALGKIFNYFKNANVLPLQDKMKKQKNLIPQNFEDLSLTNDNYVLIEYIEEDPLILCLKGMNSQIINYQYKKANEAIDVNDEKNKKFYQFGKNIEGQNTKNFLAELVLSPIQKCQAVENNIGITPICKQNFQCRKRDFLLIFKKVNFDTKIYIRKIQNVFTAGQIEPKQQIFWPFLQNTTQMQENYFKYIIVIQLYTRDKIDIKQLRKIFPYTASLQDKIKSLLDKKKDLLKYTYYKNYDRFLQQLSNTKFSVEVFCLLQKMEYTYQKLYSVFRRILTEQQFICLIQNKNINQFLFEAFQVTKDKKKRFILFKIYQILNQLSWVKCQNYFKLENITSLNTDYQNELLLNFQTCSNSLFYKFLFKEKKRNILDEERVTQILVQYFGLTTQYLKNKSKYWKKVLLNQEIKSLMIENKKQENIKLKKMCQENEDIKNFCIHLKEKNIKQKNIDLQKVKFLIDRFQVIYNLISNKNVDSQIDFVQDQIDIFKKKFEYTIMCYNTWSEEVNLIKHNTNLLKIQNQHIKQTKKSKSKSQKQSVTKTNNKKHVEIQSQSSKDTENFQMLKELQKQYEDDNNKKRKSKRLQDKLKKKQNQLLNSKKSQKQIHDNQIFFDNEQSILDTSQQSIKEKLVQNISQNRDEQLVQISCENHLIQNQNLVEIDDINQYYCILQFHNILKISLKHSFNTLIFLKV